ncbi:endonuclease/exonuclease/phosphatase family protein [Streptomyces luteolifulvus]|uniref:Endonuclease/exonuclease/phosphatase family protein n=1 Tax=Streptomyces luteolifulvus TaxID=2615112 RepID=A0A6H9V775_9ACTN|nr:endonuclease/exonuclease/phosphatase family protein [Streptomyces luteolifulvus]KAB1149427.1 endonuclease/exonuclease/phosphatase family protein [Streptomyces luteolifulvus]
MDTATARWTARQDEPGRRAGRRLAAWCAGLLFAGVSVVVGCRVADIDGVTPVPQLLAFLPWLLVPAGFGLLFSLLARWWTGLVWGVVLLALLAWFIEPYGKSGEPAGPAVAEMRVLTSNVKFGQGTSALVDAVRREKPDVVFVEECDYECDAQLKQALTKDYPHRRAVEGGGSEGSVILSRFPLKGTAGVPGTMGMPGAVADVDGHTVRLQLAHPMPPLPRQIGLWRSELGALRDFAADSSDTPTVLAGDFNASQDHAAFRHILDTGLRDAARLTGSDRTPSWPSRTAPLGVQIDHVLVSPEFSARDARFLGISGSDHRALVVDLTLHGRG